ncbi:MAG: rhombotarget lipoprotein [Gammaproteobacteria bacterium]|nr:rhombotarget lipoprotein [Gammaproteobacteria bacterium]
MRKLVLVVALVGLSGCASWLYPDVGQMRHGSSSSLVNFLYPGGEEPPRVDENLPHLVLPARVGIAFVPSHEHVLSEAEQVALLSQVAASFRDRPYVAEIEVIPTTYLRTAKGVTGMQQVARMFDVDIMALVSFDQVSLSTERDSALLYWTIVGAVVFKGNANEVQTMVDTAVFDVATAKLLFRAPGTFRQADNSTLMDRAQQIQSLRQTGFSNATEEMTVNLDTALTGFRERVEKGQAATVAWQPGHGGGSLSLLWLGVLTMVGFGRHYLRRRPSVNGH